MLFRSYNNDDNFSEVSLDMKNSIANMGELSGGSNTGISVVVV